MKIAVFWVALKMEAARTSETSVNFYQTTRCYNPEDRNLRPHKFIAMRQGSGRCCLLR
jgi:hypothetical protein